MDSLEPSRGLLASLKLMLCLVAHLAAPVASRVDRSESPWGTGPSPELPWLSSFSAAPALITSWQTNSPRSFHESSSSFKWSVLPRVELHWNSNHMGSLGSFYENHQNCAP